MLSGERESRINRGEPVIPGELPVVPPVELSAGAQAVWDRLAPILTAAGVLKACDVDALVVYCDAAAMYHRAAAEVERSGSGTERPYKGRVVSPAFRVMRSSAETMRSVGARFGLTPADRASLNLDPAPSKSYAERLLT